MKRGRALVYCATLGCDKNLVDSEALLGRFSARGFEPTADADAARIWVLNTCGFVEAARRDSLAALDELVRAKGPGRTLIVTGCLAQERGADLAARYPEIDVVAGVGNFDQVVEALLGDVRTPAISPPGEACYDGYAERPLLTPPHVAFVKISEGCDRGCAYCRIPLIRGPQRSRPRAEVVWEVRALVDRGVQEVQLVAQNTSDYGRDAADSLVALVAELDTIADLRWLRLLYLYPGGLSLADARRLLAMRCVVPYLDLPVQHASPNVLRAMRRPHDSARVAKFLETLRREDPDLVLRTTLLLGFPGEGEEDIERLADFLAQVQFDHVGTHRYSPEVGTAAAVLPVQVSAEEAADREARLLDLQADISRERQRRRLGQIHEVVIDAVVPGRVAAALRADLRQGEWLAAWNPRGVSHVQGRAPAAVARSWHFGYDLDGAVVLPAAGLAPGMRVRARFVAVTPFDALAVIAT